MGQQSTLQVGKVATTAFQQHQQHAQDIVEQSCYTASSSTATREYQMVVPFSAAHRLAGRGAAQRELARRLTDADRPRFYDEPAPLIPPPLFVQELPAIASSSEIVFAGWPPAGAQSGGPAPPKWNPTEAAGMDRLPAPWLPTQRHHILSPQTSQQRPPSNHAARTRVLPKIRKRQERRSRDYEMSSVLALRSEEEEHRAVGHEPQPIIDAMWEVDSEAGDSQQQDYVHYQQQRRRHPNRRPSAAQSVSLGELLPAPQAIKAVHEILYEHLAELAKAADARIQQRQQIGGFKDGPHAAVQAPRLRDLASGYCADKSRGVSVPRRSLEGLRACCARCVPHPAVRILQVLLGWIDFPLGPGGDGERVWEAPEQLSALWLLLEWLLPPLALLYPPGGKDDADESELLPPRMLLHVSAIPKLLASLGRRRLYKPSEAVPFLFQAAMQLMELDDKERPVVDVEELVVHWMEQWNKWQISERDLAATPREQQAPRQRLRKPEHGKTRKAIQVKY